MLVGDEILFNITRTTTAFFQVDLIYEVIRSILHTLITKNQPTPLQ